MRARVTVVIATRNRRPELLRTLGRLHELPDRPPVIVVDNASADGSAAAVLDRYPAVQDTHAWRCPWAGTVIQAAASVVNTWTSVSACKMSQALVY